MVPYVTVNENTIIVNSNIVTLTLSWGEPFNNLDPIANYTVSCSGDVTCPPHFITTDNTTRSYTITNLTPMTNYTFSVVATNSIGSGEAGVVMITTLDNHDVMSLTYVVIVMSCPCYDNMYVHMYLQTAKLIYTCVFTNFAYTYIRTYMDIVCFMKVC